MKKILTQCRQVSMVLPLGTSLSKSFFALAGTESYISALSKYVCKENIPYDVLKAQIWCFSSSDFEAKKTNFWFAAVGDFCVSKCRFFDCDGKQNTLKKNG